MNRSTLVFATLVAVAALSAGCSATAGGAATPTTFPPSAEPAETADAAQAPVRSGYTEADVRFMQHMIVHHAQALVMTDLVPERTETRDIHLLAERIEVSQKDEIAQMRNWLEQRGEEVPSVMDAHGGGAEHHAGGDHTRMPGLLSAEELDRLEAATGEEFDRLFLEYMIRHHEGALTMVAELFAREGAGQETDVFRLASDVDADQRMEIARMKRMLERLRSGEDAR